MSFITRHKATVTLAAAFVLIVSGAYLTGYTGCGSNCGINSLFGVSDAYAGPGCGSAAKSGSTCGSKTTTATAQTASAKSCSKEECVTQLMTEKGMTRTEAEAHYAKNCSTTQGTLASATSGCSGAKTTDAKVTTASAGAHSGCASAKTTDAKVTTASAGAHDCGSGSAGCGKSCGMKTAGASGCGGGSAAMKTAAATKNTHSREACIDACVAKGMSKTDATAAAEKCEQAGFHNAAATTVSVTDGKGACCAKSKGTTTTASTSATVGGSN